MSKIGKLSNSMVVKLFIFVWRVLLMGRKAVGDSGPHCKL